EAETAAPVEAAAAAPAGAALHIYGDGVTEERWFTMAELQALSGGYVEAEYYYRGKDPSRGHSLCQGLSVAYLLDQIELKEGAAKVAFRAADGYAMSYTMSNVRKSYVDETDLSKQLYMILAWMTDGEIRDDLTLVMGQNIAGEYNRTFWVKDVIALEVSL
ncbi:MAG: hypothetical protein Q4B96_04905, partial [Bacillota bacterium]|nr:hypothetical protein [Bacillota bacterium]